eukprot:TRINITY_DN24613_c0_g1_i1.p1 TRINITY_DN24613_c0_g1~~TRINITY_DN24613_c0_g1_i1.p1  ORF type:complete len:330 (+),score=50.14 TRINITY_DN24613_c0_g1_i1:91-1080(+)
MSTTITTRTTTTTKTTTVTDRKKSSSERGKERKELAFERAGDKDQFLKGVDRFVACHGGDTVKTWIGGCIQGIDSNYRGTHKEHQTPPPSNPETDFDKWMKQHKDLCQPFHAPAPTDCESPALRPVQYIIEGSNTVTPTSAMGTQTEAEYGPRSTDVVVTPFSRYQKHYGSAEEIRHTLTSQEYDVGSLLSPWSASKVRGRERWSGRDSNNVGWRLGKGGSIHHPASCGTSPARVRTLSPPKMFRYSDVQRPTTPSAPPPTPVLLTPQRSVPRSVRSSPSAASVFYSSPHRRSPGSISRCSCSPKTKTAVRKKLSYVWMPPGTSPSKRR